VISIATVLLTNQFNVAVLMTIWYSYCLIRIWPICPYFTLQQTRIPGKLLG